MTLVARTCSERSSEYSALRPVCVAEPSIFLHPPPALTVVEDTPVYLWCLASGLPQPSIRWLFHRTVSAAEAPDVLTVTQSNAGGGGEAGMRTIDPLAQVLRIDAVQQKHAGLYQCVVSNTLRTVSYNVTLSGTRIRLPIRTSTYSDSVAACTTGFALGSGCELFMCDKLLFPGSYPEIL